VTITPLGFGEEQPLETARTFEDPLHVRFHPLHRQEDSRPRGFEDVTDGIDVSFDTLEGGTWVYRDGHESRNHRPEEGQHELVTFGDHQRQTIAPAKTMGGQVSRATKRLLP
jgi:hypothetical protein